MIQKKYLNFLDGYRIDENVQQAKMFLRNRALADKRAKGDKEAKLSPEEIRAVESDRNFQKIKELCSDSPGYTLAFTKFFFNEEVPMEELKEMYKKIQDMKQFLSLLPKNIDSYASIEPTDSDPRKGFEMLGDDLESLKLKRAAKKFVDNLYTKHKQEYSRSSDAIKQKIEEIAVAFEQFGVESNGVKNEKMNKDLQDLFWIKLKRYANGSLNDVIQAALSYIKSANNSNMSKFYSKIQEVNNKFGFMNGADIVYDENKVLIIEVKSYQANKELNSNTSHCIASSQHQWDNYVGSDSNFNKQYYIYNFNLEPSNNKSVIGITIEPGGRIRACHVKNDAGFSGEIKSYLAGLKIPFETLAPMTDAEITLKRKRVQANKEIVKVDISFSAMKTAIEDGADPNDQSGIPLVNAVKADSVEKVEFLLDKGAMPNIGNAIKHSKNLKMIKILVSAGANITTDIFANIQNDYDAIKYLLDANMDPNFDRGYPLRQVAKLDDEDEAIRIMKLLISYGGDISERRLMSIKLAVERCKLKVLQFLMEEAKRKNIVKQENKKDWKVWIETTENLPDDKKKQIEKTIDDFFSTL